MELFFSVGEPSGDQHAAHLIQELKSRSPGVKCTGFGGTEMEAAGCQTLFRLTDLAVMGFLRVVPMLLKFYRLMKQAEAYFEKHKPDAVVLVDFPGFNWWIARKAKAAGIPVFYYLPPQLWAWMPWRIKRVQKFVDHVLSGLEFETDWYRQHGVDAEFVGHPFFDEVADHPLDESFVTQWTDRLIKTVAVLPGSRGHEVTKNFPIMVEVMQRLSAEHSDVRFLVACYREKQKEFCEAQLEQSGTKLPVEFFVGKTSEIIEVADCAFMVSGSVSLEMLARETPAVVFYRLGRPEYLLARMLVTCKYMTIPNLMVDRAMFPEFHSTGNPSKLIGQLTEELQAWLGDSENLASVQAELKSLKSTVAKTGATARTAEAILSRLGDAKQAKHAA